MLFLAKLITILNMIANTFFNLLSKPIEVIPAWFFLAVISALLGVLMLIVFKYTSNQTAIGRIRNRIKAHLLAMKLFNDNIPVILLSQIQILWNAFLLLAHSLVPILIMIIPFVLLLSQLSLRFQARPLQPGEKAIVTVQVRGSDRDPMPPIALEPVNAATVMIGPIHVRSKRQVYWQIKAEKTGYHQLTFEIAGNRIQKTLSIGDEFMSVSTMRPGPNLIDWLVYPAEKPLDSTSPVSSIRIDYPDHCDVLVGTDNWLISLFLISMVTAFVSKSFFNVKV